MLVYTSEATDPRDPNLVPDILDVSRRNNERDQITGLLVFRSGHFLHLIEGPEVQIRDCYARILKDKRHRSIVLQGEAKTHSRSMPNWSMAVTSNRQNSSTIEGILNLFDLARQDSKPSAPETLLTMLRIFSKNANVVS